MDRDKSYEDLSDLLYNLMTNPNLSKLAPKKRAMYMKVVTETTEWLYKNAHASKEEFVEKREEVTSKIMEVYLAT